MPIEHSSGQLDLATEQQKLSTYFSRSSLKQHWETNVRDLYRTVGEIISGLKEFKSKRSGGSSDKMLNSHRNFFQQNFIERISHGKMEGVDEFEKIESILNLIEIEIDKFSQRITEEFKKHISHLPEEANALKTFKVFQEYIKSFKDDIKNCRECLGTKNADQAIEMRQAFFHQEESKKEEAKNEKPKKHAKEEQEMNSKNGHEQEPKYREFLRKYPYLTSLGIGASLLATIFVYSNKFNNPTVKGNLIVDLSKNKIIKKERFNVSEYQPNPKYGEVLERFEGEKDMVKCLILPNSEYKPIENYEPIQLAEYLITQRNYLRIVQDFQGRFGSSPIIAPGFTQIDALNLRIKDMRFRTELQNTNKDIDTLMADNPEIPFFVYAQEKLGMKVKAANDNKNTNNGEYITYQYSIAPYLNRLNCYADTGNKNAYFSASESYPDVMNKIRQYSSPGAILLPMMPIGIDEISPRLLNGEINEELCQCYKGLRGRLEQILMKFENPEDDYLSNSESSLLVALKEMRPTLKGKFILVPNRFDLRHMMEFLQQQGISYVVVASENDAKEYKIILEGKKITPQLMEHYAPLSLKGKCKINDTTTIPNMLR